MVFFVDSANAFLKEFEMSAAAASHRKKFGFSRSPQPEPPLSK